MYKKLWYLVFLFTFINVNSQESAKSNFSAGADFYSSYIFRGTKFGNSPAIQPLVQYSRGFFTAGGWGSFDFNGFEESDLFMSFSLPAGFSIGVTDYYLPGLSYFDYSPETGSHAFEINGGFENSGFSLSANCILNRAGGAGSSGRDLYFEAGYEFTHFRILAGAGNGWHTSDSKFNVCNLGIGTSKEIKITESFSLPVSGEIILNPEREKMYIVFGITL
ncbi:MAG: hypothetical protein JXR66_07115 [Bacteroidales bacterium]|nr:hypothetical protein [Bacteroidales bacterium]